jgi:hypothetical protein
MPASAWCGRRPAGSIFDQLGTSRVNGLDQGASIAAEIREWRERIEKGRTRRGGSCDYDALLSKTNCVIEALRSVATV